jgi:hypothetical protein
VPNAGKGRRKSNRVVSTLGHEAMQLQLKAGSLNPQLHLEGAGSGSAGLYPALNVGVFTIVKALANTSEQGVPGAFVRKSDVRLEWAHRRSWAIGVQLQNSRCRRRRRIRSEAVHIDRQRRVSWAATCEEKAAQR